MKRIPAGTLRLSHWSLCWVGVLFLLLGGFRAHAAAANPSRTTAGSLRVATYNIFNHNTNLTQVVEVVRKLQADLVCVQETTRASESLFRQKLADLFPEQHYQEAPGSGGFAILSRWPVTDLRYLPPLDGPRGALLGKVKPPEGPILSFASVHLITPNSSKVDSIPKMLLMFQQAGEVQEKEIRRIESEVGKGTFTLIAGDFNSFSFSSAQTFLKSRGWVDSLASVNPEADQHPTWRGRQRGLSAPFRIDYIFHSPDLKTLESQVLSEGSSDHYPVVSRIEYPKH